MEVLNGFRLVWTESCQLLRVGLLVPNVIGLLNHAGAVVLQDCHDVLVVSERNVGGHGGLLGQLFEAWFARA